MRQLDVPSAVLPELARRFPYRYPVFFDSASSGPLARFSILAATPRCALWQDARGKLRSVGALPDALGSMVERSSGFLDALEAWWRVERTTAAGAASQLPWCGGWCVFLSYEIAAEIERLTLPSHATPVRAFALRVPAALIADHATGRVYAVAESSVPAGLAALERDANQVAVELRAGVASNNIAAPAARLLATPFKEEPPQKHLRRIEKAQYHIRAGDIYQANLARVWSARLHRDVDPLSIYAALRRANPAPFAASVRFGGLTILSSSPERLVRVEGNQISTRPIAGTRPRRRQDNADDTAKAQLVAHPKERAEHVMLLDLERNDLGRICEPGSIRVDEFMTTESYEHVHHIVSNVLGVRRQDVSPVGVLRALFPGGTITGCPKVRCMQIIAELEGGGRGPYTGSLGYIGLDGSMDFNILIRSVVAWGDRIELRAGGGIVADSNPQREIEETRAKAAGMLAAFA